MLWFLQFKSCDGNIHAMSVQYYFAQPVKRVMTDLVIPLGLYLGRGVLVYDRCLKNDKVSNSS